MDLTSHSRCYSPEPKIPPPDPNFKNIPFEEYKGNSCPDWEAQERSSGNRGNMRGGPRGGGFGRGGPRGGGDRRDNFGGDRRDGNRGDRRDNFGGDRRDNFGGDRRGNFGGDRRDNFGGDRRDNFGGDRRESFGGDRRESFGGDRRNNFGGDRRESFGGDRRDNFGGDRRDNFGGDRRESFGGDRRDNFGSDRRDSYRDDRRGSYGGDRRYSYGGDRRGAMERIKLESRDEMPMKHAETSTANADPLLAVSVPSDATAFEGKPFDLTDAVGIRIEGGDGSHAMFRSLEAAELPEMMASNLKEMNVTKATPIQLLLLYLIKHKFEHDVLVQADTGAGKTLAYLVPLVSLIHSMRICSTKPAPFRPFAIIVLPTRETAMRVATEARQLVKNVSAQVAMSFEQMDPRETARDIRNGCDIVIGTPRRLLSHVEGGMRGIDSGIGGIKMDNFCWLVVDDADSYANDQEFKRLMDLLCPHSKRLYVFSTSLSKNESDQFKRYMKSTAPFEVFGCRKTINFEWREVTTTDRRFQLLSDLELIRAAHEEMPKTVVFLDDKVVCDSICSFLNVNDILSLSLSSAANKEKREDVVSSWTSGKYKVLVCTNVAARGLKLRNVRFVINYDFPDVDTFAYRTLNSNRAGYRQHVITYFRQGETELARKTIEVLNRMRKAIPDFLYHNAGMQVPERD